MATQTPRRIAPSAPQSCMTIYESEVRVIAGLAAQWGEMETGGDLHGSWTHGRHPLVMLATGPGPEATHESVHFSQDIDFFRRTSQFLSGRYGIQCIGTHHSHHTLGLTEPSGGDLEQVRSLTSRNNLKRWCEIITTLNGPPRADGWCNFLDRTKRRERHQVRAQINAFEYTDPQQGQRVRCTLRVLPGVSPIRAALLSSDGLEPAGIAHECMAFPSDRIEFDTAEATQHQSNLSPELCAILSEYCTQLPESTQEHVEIEDQGDTVVLRISLPHQRLAWVTFDPKVPEAIESVRLGLFPSAEGSVDVTSLVAGSRGKPNLGRVYRKLRNMDARSTATNALSVRKP